MLVQTLIDKITPRYGTRSGLARKMGVTPQRMSDWYHGKLPMTAERIDQLAELGGMNDADRARVVWRTVRINAGHPDPGGDDVVLAPYAPLRLAARERFVGFGPGLSAPPRLEGDIHTLPLL